jgi:glycosyltransferase involved in cell wall biosynthesis
VPTYNGARHLAESLDSILAQGMSDLEVIVGDDASTDDSVAVAEARRDPRLRVLRFDTRAGLAGNWSRTVAAARGRYVALVGQDDRLEPFWAERLTQLLESHPDAHLAFGRRSFFERVYPAILEPFWSSVGTVISAGEMVTAAMRNCFEINLVGEPSFAMFRRDHPAVGAGFDANMWQMVDWEFFTRFFADGPILHCTDRLGIYRIHAAGASVDSAQQRRHHEEYHYLLGVVLERFAHRLDTEQTGQLVRRRQQLRPA